MVVVYRFLSSSLYIMYNKIKSCLFRSTGRFRAGPATPTSAPLAPTDFLGYRGAPLAPHPRLRPVARAAISRSHKIASFSRERFLRVPHRRTVSQGHIKKRVQRKIKHPASRQHKRDHAISTLYEHRHTRTCAASSMVPDATNNSSSRAQHHCCCPRGTLRASVPARSLELKAGNRLQGGFLSRRNFARVAPTRYRTS